MPAELARAITDRASGQFARMNRLCSANTGSGRADAVSGPSASCGMIVACSRWPDRPSVSCRPGGLVVVSLRPRDPWKRRTLSPWELALYQQSGLMPRRVYAATRVLPRRAQSRARDRRRDRVVAEHKGLMTRTSVQGLHQLQPCGRGARELLQRAWSVIERPSTAPFAPGPAGRCIRSSAHAELATSTDLSESIQWRWTTPTPWLSSVRRPRARRAGSTRKSADSRIRPRRPHLLFDRGSSPEPGSVDCAFPAALLQDDAGNALREPLAADVTAAGGGKRDAMLRIAAGCST